MPQINVAPRDPSSLQGNTEPPPVSVSMSISPSSFALDDDVQISLTITNLASKPFTTFIYPTIFNLPSSQDGLRLGVTEPNFRCTDLTTNRKLDLATDLTCPEDFSSRVGDGDDEYFHTLEPGVPKTYAHRFYLAKRSPQRPKKAKDEHDRDRGDGGGRDDGDYDDSDDDSDDGDEWLQEGHKYRWEVNAREKIQFWGWGGREDVMQRSGTTGGEIDILDGDQKPIVLDRIAPVDFEVLQ